MLHFPPNFSSCISYYWPRKLLSCNGVTDLLTWETVLVLRHIYLSGCPVFVWRLTFVWMFQLYLWLDFLPLHELLTFVLMSGLCLDVWPLSWCLTFVWMSAWPLSGCLHDLCLDVWISFGLSFKCHVAQISLERSVWTVAKNYLFFEWCFSWKWLKFLHGEEDVWISQLSSPLGVGPGTVS